MAGILLYSSGEIIRSNPTGGDRRFLELAGYLQSVPDAYLCCADSDEVLSKANLKRDIRIELPAEGGIMPQEIRIAAKNRAVLRKIAAEDFDAVIAFDVPPAFALALNRVSNLVLMVRKDLIGYEKVKAGKLSAAGRIKTAYLWLSECICLKRAKLIICQCAYDANALAARHPVFGKSILAKTRVQINNVNPSWIEDKYSGPLPEKEEPGRFRVCFIGGFDTPRKGQDIFLQAAETVLAQGYDISFDLIGGGRRLEEYARKYSSDNITFHGRLDNPAPVLAACTLLAVPSLADSCPNTVMEGLFCAVPVIGSRAGGIQEILADERALFKPDAQELADRIIYYYLNPGALSDLADSQQSRKKALSFSWPESIIRTVNSI